MVTRGFDWVVKKAFAALILSGLAALIATLVGFWSSLDPPWNYTFAYGVAALVAAAALWYVRQHGWELPAPWGKSYKPGPRRGTHGMVTTPGEDFSLVRFGLQGRMDQAIPVERGAKAVEFREPTRKMVKQADLPELVRWRFRTIAVVKRFTDDAIILDSHVQGIQVSVQVYHVEEDEG